MAHNKKKYGPGGKPKRECKGRSHPKKANSKPNKKTTYKKP